MVSASYFDGRSTRVRPVTLSLMGRELAITGEDVDLRVPVAGIIVDERLGRAPRRLRFPDGAFCEVRDLKALDALLASMGHRDGHVDRMQRRVRSIVLACVACILLTVVGYKVGLPWIAARSAPHLPPAVGRTLSVQTLKALDGTLLLPSKIPLERRQALQARYHALLLPEGGNPGSKLLFRRSPQLGANAFTLPDGTIIVLDDLVTLLGDDPKILAVVAHELGHAHGYHGLQLLLRSSAVGAFLTLYVGDISQLLAAAPAAVVQARYSQDLEREADDYGAALLVHNGLSPALMADVLQALMKAHPGASDGGYLGSHPSTQERIRHLRSLAVSSAATASGATGGSSAAAVSDTTAVSGAAQPPVTFTSYAQQFDDFEARTEDMAPDRRVEAFRSTFDGLFPGLYHAKDTARLDSRIGRALTEFPALRPAYRLVENRFPEALTGAVQHFRQVFPDFVPPLPIYLVHSLGTRDGGADYVGGRKVMLFGADVIARIHSDDSLQPFMQHELFHLEHARHFPDCDQLWCPLWQEGLATFAAATMTPGATDHQLLLDQPAPIRPVTDAHWGEALCWMATHFDSTDDNESSAAFITGGSQLPGLPSRFGYYLGLRVATEAGRTLSLHALAGLDDEEARPVVVAALTSLIDAAHAPCQPPPKSGTITHAAPRPA